MNPLFLLGGLYLLSQNKRKQGGAVNGSQDTSKVAFLYQLPGDSYTTTRMAVSTGGDEPTEVGIFDTPDKAKAIAQGQGWTVAHGGQVLQLRTKPVADS
jgi:hypothetical protein